MNRMAGILLTLTVVALSNGRAQQLVLELERDMPVAYDVDVVVVGGTTRGVEAAVAAAKEGASVFLAAPRPYLGEDVCATYRLWLEEGQEPSTELAKKLFPKSQPRMAPSPMHVKRMLDHALLDAKVDFLYGSLVTEILKDKDGNPAGIVMANRSGRQAVKAKVIIDATHRGTAARLAGATSSAYPAGVQSFKRLVLGGKPAAGAKVRKLDVVFSVNKKPVPVFEYDLSIAMKDGSFASFAKAEQEARIRTWQVGQVAASEVLFQVPPDRIKGAGSEASLRAYMPDGVKRLYVLGPCADVSRDRAAAIVGPVAGMTLGQKIGKQAAAESKSIPATALKDVTVAGTAQGAESKGEVREILKGTRSVALGGTKKIRSLSRGVPVIGTYDVVVIGGGTAGAPAGIGSARKGARTLVVEYLHGLGGVGTTGRISSYWHGNVTGFTKEVDRGAPPRRNGRQWDIEKKMHWYHQENDKAGADIWYGALGCGAVVQNGRVVGVVVATPTGRGVVLCNTVVDSTGNAVIAHNAGAQCMEIDGENISVQGTGLPSLTPGKSYTNTDWTFHDDDDVLDMWRMFIVGKDKFRSAFDMGQLIDTRVRRRIVGDIVLMPMDIYNKRTFTDTIVIAKSNFDNHGFSSHSLFMITPPDHKGESAHVPYRCLTPRGFDGILVTGLGVSAHGDTMPVIRMQPDVQNQGYAAGVAAAMATAESTTVRGIDVKKLQKHLVAVGNLPETVLTDTDSYPLSSAAIKGAVESAGRDYEGVPVILAHPAEAIPLMRKALSGAKDPAMKLRYAHILGMLGDPSGANVLSQEIQARKWDKGWNFRGMGQFGASTSPVDNLIIALGRTGEKRGLDSILAKLNELTSGSEFSHCRAVAMALESLSDPRAAAPLARLLKEPGLMGHAFTEIDDVRKRTPGSHVDNSTRNNSLRELVLARALYRSGDYEGLGEKILREYAKDLRGHYVRHAAAILDPGPRGAHVKGQGTTKDESYPAVVQKKLDSSL